MWVLLVIDAFREIVFVAVAKSRISRTPFVRAILVSLAWDGTIIVQSCGEHNKCIGDLSFRWFVGKVWDTIHN